MDGVLALGLWDNDQVPRSTNNNVRPTHTSIQETDALLHSETKKREGRSIVECGICAPPTTIHVSHNESQVNGLFRKRQFEGVLLFFGWLLPGMSVTAEWPRKDLDNVDWQIGQYVRNGRSSSWRWRMFFFLRAYGSDITEGEQSLQIGQNLTKWRWPRWSRWSRSGKVCSSWRPGIW